MVSIGLLRQLMAGLVLWLTVCGAMAAGAGVVTHLSGTLSVQRADGAVLILSRKSPVFPGDLLTTQRDSFAQINFSDGSAATLRPETTLRIEAYAFNPETPQADAMFLRLLKGGLRTVTGLIGKRGDPDAYRIGTTAATLGIRGSSGETLECIAGACGRLPQGTYHTTITGLYVMQNKGGTRLVEPGQFAFAQDALRAPVLLPADPGLNLVPLPFSPGGGGAGGGRASQECMVR
jgi:hypothetical protein